MRVVHVASEAAPFAQSGGLADVLGGLPPALADLGLDVGVMMPLYRGVAARVAATGATLEPGEPLAVSVGPHTFHGALRIARLPSSAGSGASSSASSGVTFGFLDIPALYDRDGGLYGPTGNSDWHDNHLRYGVLGRAALEHAGRLVGHASPDVLHVHDWQASTAAIYARLYNAPHALVTTIHNLAYRGIFPKHVMTELGIPWSRFTVRELEFYDQVSFLKGAMAAADVVTTVSPTYADEILTPQFGEALDAFLRSDIRRLVGIVNGIDTTAFDPATDRALPANFSAAKLDGKATCRARLAEELGFALEPDQPLIAVIARMTGQKGLDLVADIVPHLHRLNAKLVVLGSGEPDYESRFRYLGQTFTQNIAVRIGFDTALSRRIYAGSDMFLMPSRFEPCGLGQLYAMRYGSIPIVHAVGGLRDTVRDPGDTALAAGTPTKPPAGTGFTFTAPTPAKLLAAVERAVRLFRKPKAFEALRIAAMTRDSSWTASADQYVELYQSIRR